MPPSKPLPFPDDFSNAEEYVDSLLHFATTSTIFQTLCGGVHILDFFTREPSLYHKVLPAEWRSWLLSCSSTALLDLLMRDDLSLPREDNPPASLLSYIQEIRKHSLIRTVPKEKRSTTQLPRHIAVGMIPKKIHEVTNFADYVVKVADDVAANTGKEITHFVDFGSGQNYLGRTLASPPYHKHIVAVESKELNINGAKNMDVLAGVAEREKVMRNKKIYRQREAALTPEEKLNKKAMSKAARPEAAPVGDEPDLRPVKDLATIYTPSDGKGYIQYVEHRVEDGDLSNVVSQIESLKVSAPSGQLNIISESSSSTPTPDEAISRLSVPSEISLMAISIHSCGNLSHHGIRSLLLNPSVHAIAIVGCCYNLLSERLTPPSFKHPLLRPNLRALNVPSSDLSTPTPDDPHGFPMSNRLSTHNTTGIPLNITARMMGVQAPANWTPRESDSFFTRHFYRALLQKLFLDYGVVSKVPLDSTTQANPESCTNCDNEDSESTPTTPVIIGSLRKSCYINFTTYVRGALQKLSQPNDQRTDISLLVTEKMGSITDEEIAAYEEKYADKKKELSVMWSLMAFSAGVVESLIVVDRWVFLREAVARGEVRDAWVEGVFEYGMSPRNLVVVGVK